MCPEIDADRGDARLFRASGFSTAPTNGACTALAREEEGAPWLARTLDWPFPGLGRLADVVRSKAPAGEYFSVTWPGYAGALTAMAPGRFGACINQAPMWRRTQHPWLRAYDLAANALHTWTRISHMPPDQLLRQVFESCATYGDARPARSARLWRGR